jgi:hypothetical protein
MQVPAPSPVRRLNHVKAAQDFFIEPPPEFSEAFPYILNAIFSKQVIRNILYRQG